LHESEVLGGHGGWDLASFRQLGDRNLLRLEHLEHAKAVGVSEHLKALGGLSERLEACQLGWSCACHGIGFRDRIDSSAFWGCRAGGGQGIGLADTQIYRNIANYSTVVFFWWRQVAG
jgi:hypothetical protein